LTHVGTVFGDHESPGNAEINGAQRGYIRKAEGIAGQKFVRSELLVDLAEKPPEAEFAAFRQLRNLRNVHVVAGKAPANEQPMGVAKDLRDRHQTLPFGQPVPHFSLRGLLRVAPHEGYFRIYRFKIPADCRRLADPVAIVQFQQRDPPVRIFLAVPGAQFTRIVRIAGLYNLDFDAFFGNEYRRTARVGRG
jgi:hypothetical protein